jgi:acyl-CoA thioesterase-1
MEFEIERAIVETPSAMPRRKVLALLTAALLPPRAGAAASNAPLLLVVGDSLSAGYGLETGKGWVDLLRQRLHAHHPRWNVVNASISGETTAGGLARLPALLERDRPQVVVIELGGNDALRGLSLQQTADNLSQMVALCKKAGARVLLVGMQIPPNYGPVYTARFAAVFPTVAQAQGVALVPFLLSGVVAHPDWFQADNIHPTAQAQPTMLDTVWPYLQPLLRAADKGRR